jgi:hypothetical protein
MFTDTVPWLLVALEPEHLRGHRVRLVELNVQRAGKELHSSLPRVVLVQLLNPVEKLLMPETTRPRRTIFELQLHAA